MGETYQVRRIASDAPIKLLVTRGGGITGLTVTAQIVDGNNASQFLDFADNTFKDAGHGTPSVAVPEASASNLPGLYVVDGGYDLSLINGGSGPVANNVYVKFTVSGTETATDVDTWQILDYVVDLILDEVNTGADHNVKDSVGKQIRQGATGGIDVNTETVVSATATTVRLTATESAIDGFLDHRRIVIVSGPGAGQIRVIDSYVGATQTATVRAWDVNPTAASDYALLLSAESDLTPAERTTLAGVIDALLIVGNAKPWTTATGFATPANVTAVITQGDLAWVTATGFSTHSAADVDTVLELAHGAGGWVTATGFSTLTAAGVWAYDLTANFDVTVERDTAGAALLLDRMNITNTYEFVSGDPSGLARLYADGQGIGGTVAITWSQNDEDGGKVTKAVFSPARRGEAA